MVISVNKDRVAVARIAYKERIVEVGTAYRCCFVVDFSAHKCDPVAECSVLENLWVDTLNCEPFPVPPFKNVIFLLSRQVSLLTLL